MINYSKELNVKLKAFLVGLISFIVITIALVFIGHEYSISWLAFTYTKQNSESGFYVSIEPLMPVVIALITSFIVEYLYFSYKRGYTTKKTLFKLFIVSSYIYCLGYIFFDIPHDTFVMRGIKGIMSITFSYSLLYFLLKRTKQKNSD
ncbi:hypothetical protein ACIQ4I_04460 [Rummeliibacillus sp. NPDC094406]|uniref:hypothetical protein n=1 Tax=Rummeliibacillus sp. NPDC094406 TaxID=3364511 RepID=UPI003817C431